MMNNYILMVEFPPRSDTPQSPGTYHSFATLVQALEEIVNTYEHILSSMHRGAQRFHYPFTDLMNFIDDLREIIIMELQHNGNYKAYDRDWVKQCLKDHYYAQTKK